MQDFVGSLHGGTAFAKNYFSKAYREISAVPKDVQGTTIVNKFELYEYLRTQRFAWTKCCVDCHFVLCAICVFACNKHVYYKKNDDILVFSDTQEQNAEILLQLFIPLDNYGVVSNSTMSAFGVPELDFLDTAFQAMALVHCEPEYKRYLVFTYWPPGRNFAWFYNFSIFIGSWTLLERLFSYPSNAF